MSEFSNIYFGDSNFRAINQTVAYVHGIDVHLVIFFEDQTELNQICYEIFSILIISFFNLSRVVSNSGCHNKLDVPLFNKLACFDFSKMVKTWT